jgi:hypothetical protein
MKAKFIVIGAAFAVLFGVTSCSSTNLGGSLPIPFTDPETNVRLDVNVRPLPPKLCVGLDIVPRTEEEVDSGAE